MTICAFCEGEDAIVGLTDGGYPAGEKCWKRILAKNVVWDEKGMSFKEMKRLAGIRQVRSDKKP